MKPISAILSSVLALHCSSISAAAAEVSAGPSENRPNIIVILVDDMGFSDIGAYGSEIPTPNLDALAANGARFTQFYNTGRCCPTRASLLTGLYSHQAGIGHMTTDQTVAGYRGQLNDRCVTIAEVLDAAGYFTATTGKWHVGFEHGVTPWARGFQRSLNLPAGGVYFASDSAKCDLHLNGERIATNDARLPKNWYGTDLWTEFGIRFIDEALAEKKPFFLYLAHVAPHFPLQADQADIDRFRGKYKRGWDVLSRERLERQRASGLIDPDWKPEPRPDEIAAWESLSDDERDRFDHIMAVYAAVVSRMDRSVGTLVAALKERGVLENTLIFFMSDNGGNYESGPKGKTEGDPTRADSSWFCGQSWAHLQNTPFSKYKHYNHEGGIASPLIAHWPAGIEGGRWIRDPGHLIDIMATCVDLAGAEYPEEFHGKSILPMEGVSLRPLLTGDSSLPERTLYWEHEGNAAVRAGDRKLVREGLDGPWELYDLETDCTEQHDLAAARPEEAKNLAAQWQQWAERAQVLPKPGGKKKSRPAKRATAEPEPEATAEPKAEENPPQVDGRAFRASAIVQARNPKGVVLAHGGLVFGYALHFVDGRPAFSIRNEKKLTTVIAEKPVSGKVEVAASLDGERIAISVDGKEVASGKSPGLLAGQPGVGLFVGQDFQDAVGDYPLPNRFNGKILSHNVDVVIPKVGMRTPWGEKVTAENVWQEYPRPGLRRDHWTNLNGQWDYAVTPKDAAGEPKNWDGKILVPFAIEAPLSGVERRLSPDEALWYRRTIDIEKKDAHRYLLNFEAVDYQSTLWINGKEIGSHTGGYLPFSFDITDALKNRENTIILRVTDATDSPGAYQLHGKQRLNPKGIWYTPVSGIWQTVWMEEVPQLHITGLKITPGIDGTVLIDLAWEGLAGNFQAKATTSLNGKVVAVVEAKTGHVELTIPDPRLWSPGSPTLYDVKIELGDDVVHSYLGLREIGRERDADGHWRFILNGERIFPWGTLDQGWWPDGLLTPPSDEAMRSDIEFLKAAGFNTIRKHIKVEPRRYYYHCDRIGMMLWQDQVSAMADNPKWTRLQPDPATRVWPEAAHRQFMTELQGMIDLLHNHPSIVQWVPFNEAWGQHQTMEVGKWTVDYDPTRHVNIASGGNFFPAGHIVDHHQYPHPAFPFELGEGGRFDDYIKVVGEFGGHGYPVEGHVWDPGKRNWGYGGLPRDKDEWLERYRESIRLLAELKAQGIAAGIYTQTTDVEGEINGLLTYDRKVPKLPAEDLAAIHRDAGLTD